jgi:peptidoglycan lytic transglycosylase
MPHAPSAGLRKAFLFVATFSAYATVAASVRSFVISEKPATSENVLLYHTPAVSEMTSEMPAASEEQAALSEKRGVAATAAREVSTASETAALVVPSTDMAPGTEPPASTTRDAVETPYVSYGRASYHGQKSRTAGSENTNAGDLTAAHATLPFGTRARVTNIFTGKFVTVRINDHGPLHRGRIVNLSYSAAERLGMLGKGVAHVRLEVVE